MKKTLSRLMAPALLGCALLFGIVGCTSQQQAQIAVLAANAKAKAANACMVIQPTLVDLAAAQPTNTQLATFRDDNAKLCLAVTSLDATSVQSLVDTSIPQLISLTNLLPIDPAQKGAIQLALTAASVALSNWLTVYGQTETTLSTPTTTTPAAAPAPASSTTPATPLSAAPLTSIQTPVIRQYDASAVMHLDMGTLNPPLLNRGEPQPYSPMRAMFENLASTSVLR